MILKLTFEIGMPGDTGQSFKKRCIEAMRSHASDSKMMLPTWLIVFLSEAEFVPIKMSQDSLGVVTPGELSITLRGNN